MNRVLDILIASFIAIVLLTGLYVIFFLLISFVLFSFELAWERMKIDFEFIRMIVGSVTISIAFTSWMTGGIFKK